MPSICKKCIWGERRLLFGEDRKDFMQKMMMNSPKRIRPHTVYPIYQCYISKWSLSPKHPTGSHNSVLCYLYRHHTNISQSLGKYKIPFISWLQIRLLRTTSKTIRHREELKRILVINKFQVQNLENKTNIYCCFFMEFGELFNVIDIIKFEVVIISLKKNLNSPYSKSDKFSILLVPCHLVHCIANYQLLPDMSTGLRFIINWRLGVIIW